MDIPTGPVGHTTVGNDVAPFFRRLFEGKDSTHGRLDDATCKEMLDFPS